MANCGFLGGPDVSGTINTQLSTVMAMGGQSYTTAMTAMAQLATDFERRAGEIGLWQPGVDSPGTAPQIMYIAPSPVPTPPDTEFQKPSLPDIDLSGLDDLDDALDDILTELKTLIRTMPEFDGVTISDQFLVLLATHYAQLSEQLTSALAQHPTVALALSRLDEWLQPGSVGMSAVVEQAIRDRAQTDIDKALFRAEQEIQNDWLARGFTVPAGVLDAKLAIARTEAADRRAALNRDTLIEAAKWERETRQFAIEKGMAFEQTVGERFFKLREEARAVVGTWQDNHIKIQLALIEVYKAEVQAFSEAARALSAMGSTATAIIEAKIAAQKLKLDRFDAALRSEVAARGDLVGLFGETVKLHAALGQIESERVGTLAKNDERTIQRTQITAGISMKAKELELQKLLELAKVTVSSLDGIARTASQLAGGVFSALHMSAGMSVGSSYDNNSSCSENHNYRYEVS